MKIYVKVTDTSGAFADRPALAVSYYSTMCMQHSPDGMVKALQRAADKRGIKATYELADKATYDAHYAALRAASNQQRSA